MKPCLLLSCLFLIYSISVTGKTTIPDSLAIKIANQPYLKLKDVVNCASPFTTIEKRVCANLEFQAIQAEMEKSLKRLIHFYMAQKNEIEHQALIKGQEKWQRDRNYECQRVHGVFQNKRIIPLEHLLYLTDLTGKREEILEKQLLNLELSQK